MSVLQENFNYTYNGTLLTEVMMKPSVSTPSLDSIFRIMPGSKYKIQIPKTGILEKILKANSGCERTETGSGLNLENSTIALTELEMYLTECVKDFEGTVGNIIAEEALKSGNDVFDISGTQVEQIINNLLEDALRRDLFRIICWGDTGDGDSDYNQLDGMITTLLANDGPAGSPSYCVRRTSTELGTGDLAADAALNSLEESYTESAIILKQMPNSMKHFLVTGSIYENLLASYEANVNGTERQFTLLTNGPDGLNYRGIPVVPIYAWDSALADSANPQFGVIEHLIVYTTRDNHFVGVDTTAELNQIGGWYDRDSRLYKFESNMRIGYNYLHCDLTTLSY